MALKGIPTSLWDEFLNELGRDLYKQTLPRIDAAVGRMITLTTALIGGTIFFVNSEQLAPVFRFGSMICFLVSLAYALAASEMFSETVPINRAREIEAMLDRMAEERFWRLKLAYIFLYLGLFCAFLGSVLRFSKLG